MDMPHLGRSILTTAVVLACAAVGAAEPVAGDEVQGAIQVQPGDAIAFPIEPVTPRPDQTEERLDAMSWFGAARLRESRGDFRGALDAYQRAVELDPERIAIYRGLVPLAFSLNETDAGLKYALKLVELDPGDAGLMQQLARVLVSRGQVAQAATLLERAANSDSVDKKSPQYVGLQRDLGVLYAAQGNNEKAADAFEILLDALNDPEAYGLERRQRSALVADPETTYERLGQTFLDANRIDPAVEAFEKAAEARRGKPGILQYDLARVYLKAKQPEKALQQLEAYIKDKRTDRGRAAYDLLAEILTALDRDDEIDERLQSIIEGDAANPHAKLALADRYAAEGKLDEAAALYEQALEKAKDSTGYLGLADVYRRQKKADKLIELLARAAVAGAPDEALGESMKKVAADTELTDEILSKGRQAAEATPPKLDFASAYLFGKLAAEAERTDDAGKFYRLAMRMRPDRVAALSEEYGRHLLLAEKYDEAADVYREALDGPADDPTRVNFLFRLSQALEFGGKTDEALEAVANALKVVPEAALLHYQQGWINFHAERWDEAEKLFQAVIERFPQDRDTVRQARLSLSALYVERGDVEKGMRVLEEIYAVDPDDPSVNNDLGYLYADNGQKLEQAEQMIRKALASEPENAAYLDSMGWVLYRLGRFDEAAKHLEQAVAQPSGDDATLWDHLGDVYDKLDKEKKARDAWQKALELLKEEDAPKAEEIQAIEKKLQP